MMNAQQLEGYLDRIGYTGSRELTGKTLGDLILAHICTVPFENLTPYEFETAPSLNEDDVYKKLVEDRRGGYCFELNTGFHELLKALGFDAFAVAVRTTRMPGPTRPYAHKGIIVSAEGKRWYCDVGYGGPGPKGVVDMTEGLEQDFNGVNFRFVYPDERNADLQWKVDGVWSPFFRMTNYPIEPCDFVPLNLYVGGVPTGAFRQSRTVNLTLPNGSKALTGLHLTVRLDGTVTERDITSKAELEEVLLSEFGISIAIPDESFARSLEQAKAQQKS